MRETMDAPYPRYSGDSTACPKCHCPDIGDEYQEAGTEFVSMSRGDLVWRLAGGPEWMLRTCRDCSFGWPEMCADYGTENDD
jgi:hypothetical protein